MSLNEINDLLTSMECVHDTLVTEPQSPARDHLIALLEATHAVVQEEAMTRSQRIRQRRQDALQRTQEAARNSGLVGSAVWLLTVHHQRYGDTSTVHASPEGAQAALASYVDQCLGTEDYPDEAAVEAYFAATDGEEGYEIDALTVEP